jgi:hypothetical protein
MANSAISHVGDSPIRDGPPNPTPCTRWMQMIYSTCYFSLIRIKWATANSWRAAIIECREFSRYQRDWRKPSSSRPSNSCQVALGIKRDTC